MSTIGTTVLQSGAHETVLGTPVFRSVEGGTAGPTVEPAPAPAPTPEPMWDAIWWELRRLNFQVEAIHAILLQPRPAPWYVRLWRWIQEGF